MAEAQTSAADTVHHPLFARFYERLSRAAEERGQVEHRQDLLRGLSGRVVEVGAGNGLNFAHYPSEVPEVIAVEPEGYLRGRAVQEAEHAAVLVRVVAGVADRLPLEDASCAAGVASLVLCTVPHQRTALAELFRVIEPGGELRFYEHVRAEAPAAARIQDLADRTLWPRVAGGCHMSRTTATAIAQAGFEMESCRRFGFSPARWGPPIPHILGVARRPAGGAAA